MIFAAVITYADKAGIQAAAAAHREYLRGVLHDGRLLAAGPFPATGGALWVFEADSFEAAEATVRADPSHAAGNALWQLHPLAYWSAKASTPA